MSNTIWDRVLGRIETKVNRHSYFSWFHRTSLVRDTGTELVVRVPSDMAAEWLTKHYAAVIEDALAEVGRPGVTLTYDAQGGPQDAQEPAGSMMIPDIIWHGCLNRQLGDRDDLRVAQGTAGKNVDVFGPEIRFIN